MAVDMKAWREDCDWKCALGEAQNGTYSDGETEKVMNILACVEGENDGPPWIAVGQWADGKFFYLNAGCDYTGWDCQAGGTIEFYDSLKDALSKMAIGDDERARLEVELKGLVGTSFGGQVVELDW